MSCCLASTNDGVLPPIDEIAFKLRTTPAKVERVLNELSAAGLVDRDERGWRPHNWDARQFVSDVSTKRVQRLRNRERNVSTPVSETGPETEAKTEAESKTPSGNSNVRGDSNSEADLLRESAQKATPRARTLMISSDRANIWSLVSVRITLTLRTGVCKPRLN